ncbi:MAG: hypothetical protein QXF23_07340 [Candidatus Bathyarchaeia archaeon]
MDKKTSLRIASIALLVHGLLVHSLRRHEGKFVKGSEENAVETRSHIGCQKIPAPSER